MGLALQNVVALETEYKIRRGCFNRAGAYRRTYPWNKVGDHTGSGCRTGVDRLADGGLRGGNGRSSIGP